MLLKISIVLLIAWLLGVLGLYRIGELVHVLLLVGLMLFLLGRSRLETLPQLVEGMWDQASHDHAVHVCQLP